MVASKTKAASPLPAMKTAASTQQNGDATNETASSNQNVTLKTLPKGKYTLVAIDIDTTGRRLIDEIVQLAAFTPKDHFGQYIMPYMNLNPAARQRHQIRVISIGFYRMLKSMQTYKIIKSKSEVAALRDFLDWLEALIAKDASSQGIILLYHEERKFIPYMILESLKKYNLLDRFLNTVKSFANGLNLAKDNANESLQHYTLRKLSKHLKANVVNNNNNVEQNNNNVVASSTTSEGGAAAATSPEEQQQQSPVKQKTTKTSPQNERELFDGNACVRAKLVYDVALNLSNQDSKEPLDSADSCEKMLTALQRYAQPIECDLNELQAQNENLERQNSFRPVFLNYFKTTLYHRVRAVKFRIILAEHNFDLQTLNAIWSEKNRDGLAEILQVIEELKDEEKTELADLFDSYFDPAKTTIKPVIKNNNNRRRNRRIRNNVRNNDGNTSARSAGTEQGAGGDKSQQNPQTAVNNPSSVPDSTTKSPKTQRAVKRNSRANNTNNKNVLKTQTPVANDTPTAATTIQTNNATSAPVAVESSN